MMKDRQREQEDQKEDEEDTKRKPAPEDLEPKILGISMSSTPKNLQLAYLVGTIAIFGLIIYWGMSKLGPKESPKKKKKSK